MTGAQYQYDLIVLTADKNMEFSVKGVLERPRALGISDIKFQIYPHPHRDPGCRLEGHEFLRTFSKRFCHALVMFDREGCGNDSLSRVELERVVEENLSKSGWEDRAAAVVINPELEIWLWSDSPEVDAALGWKGKSPSLRSWLLEKGFLNNGPLKPSPPKDAVEAALKEVYKPRSAAIYKKIAESVSLKRCQDPAFLKLKEKLTQWFPVKG